MLIRHPVVSELLDPFESFNVVDVLVHHFGNDISCVHIDDNEGIDGDLGQLRELLTYEHDGVVELLENESLVLFEAEGALIVESIFDVGSPVDLRGVQDDLTGLLDDPLVTVLKRVILQADLEDVTH